MRLHLLLTLAFIGAFGNAVARERLLATEVIESLTLAAPTSGGTISLRITYPQARGRFPVIVLSQGARSKPAMYARLAEYWAARSHVVIQPVPPELSPIGTDPRLPATISARVGDIRFVLDTLEQIEARARALRGRLDRERIAVAGHSTGALATLLAAGSKLTYLDGAGAPPGDSRIDAVLFIGKPSRNGIVPDDAWQTLDKPTLLATGSNDEGEVAAGAARPATLFRLGDPPTAAVPRHELFVLRMDACLGGLVCRVPPGTTPDPAALAAIAEVSTAFLRAYLDGNAAAAEWLRGEAPARLANGRATLKMHP